MQFAARRRHRKTWNNNQDLKVEVCSDLAGDAEFALYQRYIDSRHDDGDMYPASAEQFEAFIKTKTVDTRFLKFYLEGQLLAVSVTDVLEQGLSAVYTFFEPSQAKRSLGSYAILWQVELAKKMQLEYLFLGYWVKGCQKMEYKSTYRPLQFLVNGQWVLLK
ncbi:MAG: arginyl-tRNA--protein-N-Asp/Glu arginylyltransferase [Pseudohongiellaceae bacterium]|jgi:arginine-tRNA-protein transferase